MVSWLNARIDDKGMMLLDGALSAAEYVIPKEPECTGSRY